MILRATTPEALEALAAPFRAAGYVAAGRWVRIAGEYVQCFKEGIMLRLERVQESGALSCAEIENIHDLAVALLQACGEDFQLAVEAVLVAKGVHDDIVTGPAVDHADTYRPTLADLCDEEGCERFFGYDGDALR
jgi:hypothetical protein